MLGGFPLACDLRTKCVQEREKKKQSRNEGFVFHPTFGRIPFCALPIFQRSGHAIILSSLWLRRHVCVPHNPETPSVVYVLQKMGGNHIKRPCNLDLQPQTKKNSNIVQKDSTPPQYGLGLAVLFRPPLRPTRPPRRPGVLPPFIPPSATL